MPYAQIPITQNDTPAHEALALKMARESIVLLKNDGLLPLDRAKIKRIAVIGTNADSMAVLLGNYNGTPARPVTILNGIRNAAGTNIEVVYEPACPLALRKDGRDKPDAQAWTQAIAVRLDVGRDHLCRRHQPAARRRGDEGGLRWLHGGDRTRIELPPVQNELLKALQGTGKPVVFINCSGSAIALPWDATIWPQSCRPGIRANRADARWPTCCSATSIPPGGCRSLFTVHVRSAGF